MIQLPEKLLQSLESITGFNRENFLEAHNQPPPTSIRLHPQKAPNGIIDITEKVLWCESGKYLSERPLFTLDPLFHAGAYYVQEASSMFLHELVTQIFPKRNDLRVLDLCAAPGGISTLLASILEETSLLISNEVIRTRASILEENCTRWGYTNNWVTCNDPKDFGKLEGYFDLIVIDAPCSGSGLFRKDIRALENWTQENVELCAARQKRIIADVWNSLKEDGVLIYATCSYSPEEDEGIVEWLEAEFETETIKIDVNENWNIVKSVSKKGNECFRFFPDKVKGEGFFIAAIRKKGLESSSKIPKCKPSKNEKLQQQIQTILVEKEWTFIENKEGVDAIYTPHEGDYHLLKQHLYFRKTGVNIGNFTPKEWIPSHQIALSIDKKPTLPKANLDKETALRFLKKEDIGSRELAKGWYLVTYEGLALGWIKSLGNRSNNYLPKNWRIRMELPTEDWA